jgi:arylsulfatase A-like enzyme
MIMLGPGIPEGKNIYTPVSLVDIVPTLMALLKIDPKLEFEGVGLGVLWGENPPEMSSRYIYAGNDHNNVNGNIRRSVRQGRFKLHHDRLTKRWVLHELVTDPGERRDVSSQYPEVTQRLREALKAFSKKSKEGKAVPPLSAEEEAQLKSLGYLQ